jgi:hypothetical protein
MDLEEREIFSNVHGINDTILERVRSEIETRKLSHKDFFENLKLDNEMESARKIFDVLKSHKSNANSILEKYKRYMNS